MKQINNGLDTAIEFLMKSARICAQNGESDERESCLYAIKVLEAARNVDGIIAIESLRCGDMWGENPVVFYQVEALLNLLS